MLVETFFPQNKFNESKRSSPIEALKIGKTLSSVCTVSVLASSLKQGADSVISLVRVHAHDMSRGLNGPIRI